MTEQFKKMPFKKKVEHIWEYYRLNIFITLFILFVVGSLLNTIVFNPTAKSYTTIAFYDDDYVSSEVLTEIENNFTEKFVKPEENLKVKCISFYSSDSDPTIAVDMSQKFQMLLLGKEIDVIATNPMFFTQFAEQGVFSPLNNFLSEDEINELEKQDMIFYSKGYDGEKAPYGICLKNTTTSLKNYEYFPQQERYVGISSGTQRIDNAKNIILEIIK